MREPTIGEIDLEIQGILAEEEKVRSWLRYEREESKLSPIVWYSLYQGEELMGKLVITDNNAKLDWHWEKFNDAFADTLDLVLIRPLTRWSLDQKGLSLEAMLTTDPSGEIRFRTNEDNPRRLETFLENSVLGNVLDYLAKEFKDGKSVHSYKLENGATYQLILDTANPKRSENGFALDALYTIAPENRPNQIYDLTNVITFSGMQLTNDRVKLVGECNNQSEFIQERFNSIWANMLQDFNSSRTVAQVPDGADAATNTKGLRVPKAGSKKFNEWKAIWRKVKGHWRGGRDYTYLANLANVGVDTIADIVKAGDAGLLD
jgi:hypothetical protein